MFGDSYGTGNRQSWRDVMQVCLNGHVINAGVRKNPQRNQNFCDSCGKKLLLLVLNVMGQYPVIFKILG